MLPLVLGGIALGVVGYGVKEYLEEEGYPWDKSPSHTFAHLYKRKVEIYDNELLKLKNLLLKIDNIDAKFQFKDTVNIVEERLAQSEVVEDIEMYAKTYDRALNKAYILLASSIFKIESLTDENSEYGTYTKSEKKLVKKVYKLVNTVQSLLALTLLKEEHLDVDTAVTFKVLNRKLDEFRTDEHLQSQIIKAFSSRFDRVL